MDNDDSLVGQLLGDRYALARLIGRGGMAAVYQAWDRRLERFVAIKMFSVGTANNDARRDSEVKLLARVNHPGLVTLHDAHLAPAGSGAPSYLVMELVEGPNLSVRLGQGPMPVAEAAGLTAEIAEALMAIHESGVIHRDLKPGNILLAPTGMDDPVYRAKIADFGIAHLVGADPLTTVGTVIGTAAYLSPEQAMGRDATPASDIYSLGLIALECLTGERAFTGTMLEAVTARLARDPEIPPSVPAPWASLLARMTARDPGARPTAHEVVTAVRGMPAGDAPTTAETIAVAVVPAEAVAPADTPTEAMLPPTKILPVAVAANTIAATEGTAPTERFEPVAPAASADPAQPARAVTPLIARPASNRGTIAALLSLVAAVIVAVAVGAGAFPRSGGSTVPTHHATPSHTSTTTHGTTPIGTTTTHKPQPSPSASQLPSPVPTVTPPTPPGPGGPGKGTGPGHGKGHDKGKHKP